MKWRKHHSYFKWKDHPSTSDPIPPFAFPAECNSFWGGSRGWAEWCHCHLRGTTSWCCLSMSFRTPALVILLPVGGRQQLDPASKYGCWEWKWWKVHLQLQYANVRCTTSDKTSFSSWMKCLINELIYNTFSYLLNSWIVCGILLNMVQVWEYLYIKLNLSFQKPFL